ncbi:hypothetical protein RUR49_25950 [Pseudoxanthobacter sp. M-2]|uniref:hypothetical protein n=1 Tax=Pseudoxanthobacter sp. M-2 TaxID=3078754 RepID=UPI0038FC07E0
MTTEASETTVGPDVHPRLLTPFAFDMVEFEEAPEFAYRAYTLACQACGGPAFEMIRTYVHRADINEEAIAGMSLRCIACGETRPLFDGSKDGYEGELGYGTALAGKTYGKPLTAVDGTPYPPGPIKAGFAYNGDEYVGTALEEGRRPVDLFDWFTGFTLLDGEWVEAFSYECA